jgi:5-methylcytosine-specific restriction endonuclease McrA
MAKPNPRKANGSRRRNLVARVRARDDRCWLCKRAVDKALPPGLPGSPEVHEVIPVAQGGSPYDLANCVLTHRRCNQWIGNRTPAQLAHAAPRRRTSARPAPPPPVTTSRRW